MKRGLGLMSLGNRSCLRQLPVWVAWLWASIAALGESAPPQGWARTHDWLVQTPAPAVTLQQDGPYWILENGLIRRTWLTVPNAVTTSFDNLMTGASLLRAVEPEAAVTVDGHAYPVGGLRGQPDRAYLLPSWIHQLTNDPAAFRLVSVTPSAVVTPLEWKRTRPGAALPWPPVGRGIDFNFASPNASLTGLVVRLHYELYEGLPVLGKWLVVSNGSSAAVTLDRVTIERLAAVEAESAVDERPNVAWRTPAIDVFSDYMFKGMDVLTGNVMASWRPDPEFTTQVSYALNTPCVLVVEPPVGPGLKLKPGESFTSPRAYLVVHDSTERERQGLTLRRAHRVLAPWSTENPIMMHVRNSESKAFRLAVDQCAEVGFEMIIYTFGSGLDMENQDPAYLSRVRADVDYAHARGIQVGAYSLFSSRRIDDANDVINPKTGRPGGAIFGNAPCLGSAWGLSYLSKLTNFITQTGLDLLEHDGPYPGDLCASTNHPGHRGLEDSQWVNWRLSADLYAWCRARGVYVNQPDYYFFAGGSKTAMGYRESNWSLPRAQQMVHARQNIFDGTWTKPVTAGWMFVPLTEYQGGGAAATLEPLSEHLTDYEAHLANTLGAGVQACWRGPRLYDTDATRDLLKKWVSWFKQYRDILESDVIHLRRADGRDIDALLHVNPALAHRGLAVIYNPLPVEVERWVELPLHYAGLSGAAVVREAGGAPKRYSLDAQQRAWVLVKVPAEGRQWLLIEAP